MKNIGSKLKKIVIVLSVYFSWIVILNKFAYGISEDTIFESLPLTILTIYVWKNLNK